MAEHGEIDNKKTNSKAIKTTDQSVAVALNSDIAKGELPQITAAARGKLAEQILKIAFENDIKVREDKDLANILADMELDSPVPTEALMAVAEILSYVYRANGEPDPFNAILETELDKNKEE